MAADEKKTPGVAPAPGSPEEASFLKGVSRFGALLGLALVLAALVVALLRRGFGGVWVWVPLGLGGALLVAFAVLNPREIAAALSGRTGTGALNTAVTILAALVIWFGFNYFGNRFDRTWKTSTSQLEALSGKTRQIVGESLDTEVQIIALEQHGDLEMVLGAYERLSKRLVLRHVFAAQDPKTYEKLLKDLKLEEAKPDAKDLIVACGDCSKVIPFRDLYQSPTRWYPYWSLNDDLENKITSAILSVAEARQTRVRFSTGHGERDPENYAADGLARLSGLLERDNYDVEKLPSLGPSILEECDVLVAAGPTRRFADHELEILSEYLRKGGKLLVLLEPQTETGLEDLLTEEWAIEVGRDRVFEPNEDLQWARRDPESFYAFTSPQHPVTASLSQMNYRIALHKARTMRANPEAARGQSPYGAVPILGGSRDAYGETDFEILQRTGRSIRDEADNDAVLGVALSRRAPQGMPGMPPMPEPKVPDTRIVALGDADIASERLVKNNSANGDLLLNAVRWLAAKERQLGIAKRPRRRARIEGMSSRQSRALSFLVVIGLPVLSILLGGLVWWVRRR